MSSSVMSPCGRWSSRSDQSSTRGRSSGSSYFFWSSSHARRASAAQGVSGGRSPGARPYFHSSPSMSSSAKSPRCSSSHRYIDSAGSHSASSASSSSSGSSGSLSKSKSSSSK